MGRLFEARVPVKEIARFVWRSGDLGSDRPSSLRAAEGIEGHRWLQSNRGLGYRPELPLSLTIQRGDVKLTISGRADGVDNSGDILVVEEIKTVSAPLMLLVGDDNPLHWAQVKIYAAMLARERNLPAVEVRLAYLHFESRQIRNLSESMDRAALDEFLDRTTSTYLDWLDRISRHRARRDRSAANLSFPHAEPRPGQMDLAEATARTISHSTRLFAQGPTGCGKTMGVLHGAVQALCDGDTSQLFFLTARTTGRVAATDAFTLLKKRGLDARVLVITARDKICPHRDCRCAPGDCPVAACHHDRIGEASLALFEFPIMSRDVLEAVASEHRVCPFELSMEMLSWVDAVICDVNYVFDPHVSLKVDRTEVLGPRAYLVDEAHNLVDRARDMFSSSVSTRETRMAASEARECAPALAPYLARMGVQIDREVNSCVEENARYGTAEAPSQALIDCLDSFCEATSAMLDDVPALRTAEKISGLFFRALAFIRFSRGDRGEGHVLLATPGKTDKRLEIYCVDPSFALAHALGKDRSAVFFSATLSPMDYFVRVLGGTEGASRLVLPSPFPRENRSVSTVTNLAVTYRQRQSSLGEVVDYLGTFTGSRAGNYLVYLPSYKYLEAAARAFSESWPERKVILQQPQMTEPDREDFLAHFGEVPTSTTVGFAVLGGAFAEGIDLVGDRLCGAAIVSVGLPQVGPRRELIRSHFEEAGQDGFGFAYIFPGINKVLQAAGRVVRTQNDRGAVLLLDRRFSRHPYTDLTERDLGPVHRLDHGDELSRELDRFWAENNSAQPQLEVDNRTNQS